MSCAHIRAYAEGWGGLQKRLYGKTDEETDSGSAFEDGEEVSEQDQIALFQHLIGKPKKEKADA